MHTVSVATILRQGDTPIDIRDTYEVDDIPNEGGINSELRIRRNTTGFRIFGQIRANIAHECDRCLTPFQQPIELEVDEQFVLNSLTSPHNRDQEIQIEEFFEEIGEHDQLDIPELLRQVILTETASKHICGRAECADLLEDPARVAS